jgi:hypothetical protein
MCPDETGLVGLLARMSADMKHNEEKLPVSPETQRGMEQLEELDKAIHAAKEEKYRIAIEVGIPMFEDGGSRAFIPNSVIELAKSIPFSNEHPSNFDEAHPKDAIHHEKFRNTYGFYPYKIADDYNVVDEDDTGKWFSSFDC